MELNNKIALVTGAASGIGKAVAYELAFRGATVVAWDKKAELGEIVGDLNASLGGGSRIAAEQTDLADITPFPGRVAAVCRQYGSLDMLVNCAGRMQTVPLTDIDEQGWDRMLDLNLKSVFFLMQAAAKPMIEQRSGAIVNVSSIAGRSGRALTAHYAASKSGIISITRSAALAFGGFGVRVNAVAPGVIVTPMTEQINRERAGLLGTAEAERVRLQLLDRIPLKRLGEPEDVARAVAYLCSPQAEYIHGQTLNVCGGLEMD